MLKVKLVAIDWQNDFVDPNGSLYVPGADKAAIRVAAMINRLLSKIYDIDATLDTHPFRHIAHPIWWVDSNGNHPTPFTEIAEDDVLRGTWRAANLAFQQRSLEYVQALKRNSRYVLRIWPPHCLVGEWGNGVYPEIAKAFRAWELKFGNVNYHIKGNNPYTEHYSAIQADVPDPADPTTMLNTKPGSLIHSLSDADIILLTGIASSHCEAETVRDVANNFGEENIKKLQYLEDATAPVPGCESLTDKFVNEMVGRGMQVSNTVNILA